MAPLPPNGTPRFKVVYTVNLTQHDFQVRSHDSPSAIGAKIDAFLLAIQDACWEIVIDRVDFAADNSNIFLPVTTGIETNVYSEGVANNPVANWFYGFVGRTSGGRRWHLDVFGARDLGINFRFTPGENPDLSNGVAALQDFGASLVGIDDAEVTVYPYINAGDNAHYQRAVRG